VYFLAKHLKISPYLTQAIPLQQNRRNPQPKKILSPVTPFSKMKGDHRENVFLQLGAITWTNKCGSRNEKGGPYLIC